MADKTTSTILHVPAGLEAALNVRIPGLGAPVGLGDLVARATKAVGIKPCGGCQKRKQRLNRLVQFAGKPAGGDEPTEAA